MLTLEIILRVVAGFILVLANAFFVVAEFALTRLRQLDESEFQQEPQLKRAWKMTEELEIYLTGCQLGISSTSVLMGVVAEPGVTALIAPMIAGLGISSGSVPAISIVISVVLINLIHKIWGEQAPTYLGVERPKEVARWTASGLYWWTKIMYPFIIMGDGLAKATLRIFGVTIERSWTKTDTESGSTSGNTERGELRRAMGEILTSGSLPKERKKEVLRALDIDYIPVRKKMTDREEIVAVSTEYPLTENLQLMTDERRFSRYPLMGNTLEDFQGTLYIADVFAHIHNLQEGKCQLRDLATPPLTFDSEMPVSQAIDEFQKHRQELALIEEDGQVIGLITITQSLEAIAGEIEDPFDSASR